MGYEVHAKFTWIDRLAQCPWVTVDADTPQVLRFFRGTYSKPTETGRYLVFLLQTDINEYALAALPSDALFNLDSPRSDPADLPRGRLAKAHLRSLPESELRTRVSALTIPDQRQEFEASSVSEMHENCAPLKGSMCRLRAFTREAPGEQARSPYRAFLHVIACYVPSDQLDRDALVKSEGPDPYHRCGVRLEGNWVDGYFIPTRIYSESCGLEILKPTDRPALDEAAVRDIAQQAVADNDDWADRATYDVRRTEDGWTVTAWRITGYDEDGTPRHTPGGHRLIIIDDAGNVQTYLRGR